MFYLFLDPYVILTTISQLFHVSECIPYEYREWKEGEIQLSQYTYTTVKGAGRWKWEIFGFIILIIVLAIIAYFIYKYYKKKKHEKQEKELSQKNSNTDKDMKMTHYITNSHDNFYSSSIN